ncbi:MAG TPA: hypothetical protein VG649_13470 [Candidatus Angelobacter sp.]|nr:hypothetical protein [Candidatus Angelobacter sp.]
MQRNWVGVDGRLMVAAWDCPSGYSKADSLLGLTAPLRGLVAARDCPWGAQTPTTCRIDRDTARVSGGMGTAHWVLKKADSLPGLIATGKLGFDLAGRVREGGRSASRKKFGGLKKIRGQNRQGKT